MRVALCMLLTVAAASADWSEVRDRFREAYREEASAAERRRAILDLGASDLPEAAELLVDLWRKLEKDAVRQRRELFELRVKHRRLRLRAREERGRADALLEQARQLNARALDVNGTLAGLELDQAAVVEAFGSIGSAEALRWLAEKGLGKADAPALLEAVATRLALADESGLATLLLALEKLRRADELVPLLHAVAKKGADPGPGLATLLKHLGHNDWAVRVAASHALARAGRPEAIPAMIRAMGREPEHSRARLEHAHALALLTGKNLGPFPDLWSGWWRDNEAEVMAGRIELGRGRPEPVKKLDQGHFYGIPQEAERIIYVLDVSGSMEVSMENPQWIGDAWVPARDDEESRYDAARKELLKAVRRLRKGSHYAVVLYSDHVEPLHEQLVEATDEVHAYLQAELDRRGPDRTTNIYEALDHALRMANVHPESPTGASKADAIFLISDGAPTDSEGQPEDPNRILAAVRNWNALQRVAVHAIGIGKEHSADFLKRLAEENGGTYYPVLPKKDARDR